MIKGKHKIIIFLSKLKHNLRHTIFLITFNHAKLKKKNIKLIVGGAGTIVRGWLNTDGNTLDITSVDDWSKYFEVNGISNILAEHVWEHLTEDDSKKALDNCFKFLKKGGRLRIAVPDGNFPDKEYIDFVKPGGTGIGSDDHKLLYTHETLRKRLEESGFVVEMVEYFDDSGHFLRNKWSVEDGFIHRSFEFDKRNKNELKYTSLILDGIKK